MVVNRSWKWSRSQWKNIIEQWIQLKHQEKGDIMIREVSSSNFFRECKFPLAEQSSIMHFRAVIKISRAGSQSL
jgi:hypothetical protein